MEVISGDTNFIFGEILYLEHIFSQYLLNSYYLLGTGHLKMKRQTFLEGSSSAGGRSHENRYFHYSLILVSEAAWESREGFMEEVAKLTTYGR